MSYSAFVHGCTDRRLPFCVTIIARRPFVGLSVSSDTTAGNRSTKVMSTMNHTGDAGRAIGPGGRVGR